MSRDNDMQDDDRRVVDFRRRPGHVPNQPPPPVQDLDKFQSPEAPEDYRHRMMVNVAAFLFVIGLIGGGLWLADSMASMRKNQDCVLSGRSGCTPVEAAKNRW